MKKYIFAIIMIAINGVLLFHSIVIRELYENNVELKLQLDSIKTIVKVHDSVINEFPDDDFNTFQPTDN